MSSNEGEGPQVIAGPIHFKVNEAELISDGRELTAEDILRMAKEKGAFEGDPEKYILKDLAGDTEYAPGQVVPVKEGDQFLALPGGNTPVT